MLSMVFSKYFPCGFLCHDKEGNVVTYIDIGNIDLKGFWNSAKPLDGLNTILLFVQQDLMQLELQNKKVKHHFCNHSYNEFFITYIFLWLYIFILLLFCNNSVRDCCQLLYGMIYFDKIYGGKH
ncbi:UNVERIFIED_CONTAM: hypothetical protein NCL1_33473 [Trichonephila clavipes]